MRTQTLGQIWMNAGQSIGTKVRWLDWGDSHLYFVINSFDSKLQRFFGTLDNGEEISFSFKSDHWKLYEERDELLARAV